jgi:lipoprotein-releasing system permease protein
MSRATKTALGVFLLAISIGITVHAYLHATAEGGDPRRYVLAVLPFALGVVALLRGTAVTEATGSIDLTWKVDASSPVSGGRTWSTESLDQPFSVGESIGIALRALFARPLPTVVPMALLVAISLAVDAAIVSVVRKGALPAVTGAEIGVGFMLVVLQPVVFAALYETTLATLRRERIAPGVVLRAIKRAPKILVLTLVTLLAALAPSGLLALPFIFAPFFVVDENASILRALKLSWKKSTSSLGTLWLLHLALAPLLVLGWTSWVIAVAVAPIHLLAIGYGYLRATGKNELPWLPAEFASSALRSFLQITFLALAALFTGLVIWVQSLPTLRGTAWSIQDTLIRATTILAGMFSTLVLLALLLPYILDRLEGRRFTSFVAARHVRSQKSGFLTVISILSICGVAISSCALSSVVSVMGGFSQDLKRKILGNNAHIVIDTTAGTPFADYEATLERVRGVPGVVGATPVVHGEVMASSASNLAGVVVTGIVPTTIDSVIELGRNIEVGKLDYLEHPEKLTRLPPNEVIGMGPGGEQYFRGADLPGLPDDIDPAVRSVIIAKPDRPGIILGRELAKTLHVYVGDEVTLVSPLGDLGPMGVMPRTKRFRVAAIFYSGMYEYDASADKISAIEVKVDDAEHADLTTPKVEAAVARPELRVRDWHEINKNLFSALKLERFATFIILSIAIMVASFCIVCTLLLMVTEKGKEIAILKAVGASDGSILRTFMTEGMIIGGIGTTFGVVAGLAVCTGLSWFGLRLDPEVYYIDRLPISVNGWDFLTVALAALIICTLSTLYPAYAASRLRPVDGLRNE